MTIRALASDLRSLIEAERFVMRSPTADEIVELRKFARSVYKGLSVKQHRTADGVRAEVRGPYKDEKFTEPGAVYQKIVQWLIDRAWVQWPEGSADRLRTQMGHALQYDAFYDIGLLMKKADVEAESLRPLTVALRRLTEGADEDVVKAVKALERIAKKHQKYERTEPDKPPAYGSWSPRDGRFRVVQNQTVHANGFSRLMRVGVNIGAKFAWPVDDEGVGAVKKQRAVIDKIEQEVRAVLQPLVKTYGGFIEDQYGTAYSQLGWVSK